LRDGDGLTCIDGGWALEEARTRLADGLAQFGAGLPDIRRFLVTHIHRDHYSNAVAVRREFGSRVLLGVGEGPNIEVITGPAAKFGRQFDRLVGMGGAELAAELRARAGAGPAPDELELPDDWIGERQEFQVGDRTLVAVATPGHTRGHVVFIDEAASLLFAGDHVLPHITPSVAFEPAPPPLGLRDFLDSLRLVRSMPDMALLPAHGPAGSRVHARVDELLAHHAARLDAMAQTLRSGWRTAFDVAHQIGWTRRNTEFDKLDPFNKMLAVFETAQHLELLVAQGIAVSKEADGVVGYGLQASTSGPST
jgi:glyoxylase-like metal-dependent hydrolase (beta-lactamase superfamily II)